MVSVQIPLPMLWSLELAHQSFLDVCISAGQEVLARGMEEDRMALCGAKGQHDEKRQVVRWTYPGFVDRFCLGLNLHLLRTPPSDASRL